MTEPAMPGQDLILAALYRRAFAGDAGVLPVFFDVQVLDRYRGLDGYTLKRTNTVGRLKQEGGFSLDFGITPTEDMVHVPAAALSERLPERERAHWLWHMVSFPPSRAFLQMQLHLGSCFDDGDLRGM